jgi:hypothetical protein
MFTTLLLLGIALLAFGALVLLKYSDRPGGTIKSFGVEVSSAGAGLPLIALGVGFIAFAAVRFSPTSRGTDVRGTPAETTAKLQASDTSCVAALLSGVSRDRVDTVEVGMQGVEVIGSHQTLNTPFVLLLTENGQRIGAMRIRLYQASNSSGDLYKIEQAIDAGCANVEQMRNSRGGNPRDLMNWDTLRATLGAHQYDLRIGGEGNITVSFTRIAGP